MREILGFDFREKTFPHGWIEIERRASFERLALRSNGAAVFQFLLPVEAPNCVRFELEVEPLHGANLGCGDGTMMMIVDLERPAHRILYSGRAQLASSSVPPPQKGGRSRVVFEFEPGRLRASIDGQTVLDARDPRPAGLGRHFELGFWEDCLVHEIKVLADTSGPASDHMLPVSGDFHMEVAVDFFDDLIAAPWDRSMLDRLFAEFEAWGIRRCHWIYYGKMSEGFWDEAAYGADAHACETYARIGEFFPAAVEAAHAHGIEIYGLIKPFDMGLFHVLSRTGKLPFVGGRLGWVANFPAQRRDLLMARKPDAFGPARNSVFTRIDLVKEDGRPAAFSVDDVEIFISTDNEAYVPYRGPVERQDLVEDYPRWQHDSSGGKPSGEQRRCRVFRFLGLEISAPYVALAVASRDGSFANDLLNILHVFGPNGEERRLTYGILPRAKDFVMADNVSAVAMDSGFRNAGIHFDVAGGLPTSVSPGYEVLQTSFTLDAEPGFVAFAAGKERGPVAALSPSFQEVRQWWLSWVQDCLDAGADGIELRVRNHHSHLTWAEYGFEKPVRDLYLDRFGVDLWTTDEFDKGAWRRLRGEAYTEFIRETRQLVHACGKKLGLHISHTNGMEPETGAAMDIHWDWKTWIAEGLADSITLKDIWPGSTMAEEILSRTRPLGIPVIFCPYANNLWLRPHGEDVCSAWIQLARLRGCDGFQFYQATAALTATLDGRIHLKQPVLRDIFRRHSSLQLA